MKYEGEKRMPSTIKDISRETGLSLATISKYLNGGNVLPKNKEKIDAAVEKLHYQVNEIARGLVTRRTKTIGVVCYNIASIFNGTMVSYIGAELSRQGYGMLICDSRNDEKQEAENIKFLVNKKVDGIIVTPVSKQADFLAPADAQDIPVVLLDRRVQGGNYDSVTANNQQATYLAGKFLIQKHHRKIAVIASLVEYTGVQRLNGLRTALTEAGLSLPPEYLKLGLHTVEDGYRNMKELIRLKNPPTAVMMTNYDLNLGAVMAVNEENVDCPGDLSMLGFDDLILPHIMKPDLTVVAQPMEEMGRTSVELVLRRITRKWKKEEAEEAHSVVCSTQLKEGDSVRDLGEAAQTKGAER